MSMESIYVCLFSNGYVKVGRSLEPRARIALHAERVSCLGVEITGQLCIPVAAPNAQPHEQLLIDRCVAHASQRFKSEWFAGLDFAQVCQWAKEITVLGDIEAVSIFKTIRERIGVRQGEMGLVLGCTPANVSLMDKGQTVRPETAKKLIVLAAQRGLHITLNHVYGVDPLPEGRSL
jgi:putative transcriptional regulator